MCKAKLMGGLFVDSRKSCDSLNSSVEFVLGISLIFTVTTDMQRNMISKTVWGRNLKLSIIFSVIIYFVLYSEGSEACQCPKQRNQ